MIMEIKTALEWLEEQLLLHTKIENSKYFQQQIIDIAIWQFNKYIKHAKQMEKEQIIIAHGEKSQFGFDSSGNYFSNKKTGEQYYNETYGK